MTTKEFLLPASSQALRVMMEAIKRENVVETIGTGPNQCKVYEFLFKGKTQKVAVGVGSNGYVDYGASTPVMARNIKLMAEYGGTVLWRGPPDEVGPISPDNLEISEGLRQALKNWADQYDNTLNRDDPAASRGFNSKEVEQAFECEGIRIWRLLQQELGEAYKVVYYSEIKQRIID